ncbi:MAG TPA: outer membrane protein transport protein [Candidatus Saccharimonadales bacterium]|nr:outer membrane protein transport protein [Candidatus Saccharimonadales bacterium]
MLLRNGSPRAAAPRVLGAALLAAAALAAFAAPGRTAGFALFEQGAAAIGRGGAYAAGADDPSALFYNPAALAGLDGSQLSVSPTLLFFDDSFAGAAPYPGFDVREETDRKAFPLPCVYASQRLQRRVTGAVGLFAPFGLETDWTNSADFSGRFVAWRSRIEQYDGAAALAAELSPRVRVGAALDLAFSKILLRRAVAAPLPGADFAPEVGTVQLESSHQSSVAGTFGIQVLPTDQIKVGATLRTGSSNDFQTPATFDYLAFTTGNAREDSTIAAQLPRNQDASVRIPFPMMLLAGIEARLSERLTAELDLNWTRWSTFDTVALVLSKNPERNVYAPEHWTDVTAVRLGLEYRLEPLRLRAGAYFDPTPQPAWAMSPLISDTNRLGFTVGAGYRAESGFRADAFALLVEFQNRSTDQANLNHLDGTYRPRAFIVGASAGWGR